MALVSDLTTVPLSGYTHIDALLDQGPDWNYLTPAGNTIRYTFSTASGNESGVSGQTPFSTSQRYHTTEALRYISQLTGIQFVETTDGSGAHVHFANHDIPNSPYTSGLCSWRSSYSYVGNTVTSYDVDVYVYLDNVQFAGQNANLTPGGAGYETLLHELGHMLGLKHPFETTTGNSVTLPSWQDYTYNTLMSYDSTGGAYAQFSPYDVAALMWLYGGDGLGGKLGTDTGARFLVGTVSGDRLTGSANNDVLRGGTGDDYIDGALGSDTAQFGKTRTSYQVSVKGAEIIVRDMSTSANEGIDTLTGVELFQFADGILTLAQLTGDNTAPAAPWISVPRNQAGYVDTNAPTIFGVAEAHASVQVVSGNAVLGTVSANSSGSWNLTLGSLADGSYTVYARATDAAGNVSALSVPLTFMVDEKAPAAPAFAVQRDASGLIAGAFPVYSGTGEAGSTIRVTEGATLHGTAVVAADGSWSLMGSVPMENGGYTATAAAIDAAGNVSAPSTQGFKVDLASGFSGSSGDDTFVARSGNNVYDGQGGIDTSAYGGVRSGFAVSRAGAAVTVTDTAGNAGTDTLFNVERLQFGDAHLALDIEGNGGQAYRIYNAVLDRAPDTAGLGFWMAGLDRGMSLREVAGHFMSSAEFGANFGTNLSNLQLVQTLYQNILDRPAEQAGVDYWVGALDAGRISQAEALAMISESAENRSKVDPAIINGFVYDPWSA